MGEPRRPDALADAAQLYYVDGRTQQQVARALGTTRSNVSRMLRAARDQGIVRFEIIRPVHRQRELEERLLAAFPLREAVVMASDGDDTDLQRVGQLAASWLTDNVEEGTRLAVSWGRTLQSVARALPVERSFDVEVVQSGGDLQLDPRYSGHELVREIAARLGGSYSYLHAPAILDSPATVAGLRSLPAIRHELEKALGADIALVGIGAFGFGFSTQLLESAHLSVEDRAAFGSVGAAGDILGRFFGASGSVLETPLRHRVLALELEELREVPTIVGVAAGVQKAPGIRGALRGRWVDVLVTDRAAATGVLQLEEGSRR